MKYVSIGSIRFSTPIYMNTIFSLIVCSLRDYLIHHFLFIKIMLINRLFYINIKNREFKLIKKNVISPNFDLAPFCTNLSEFHCRCIIKFHKNCLHLCKQNRLAEINN
ncbi:hypothetical protein BpHYR1_040451 [Brachionus plicatilis]|uniref:Uncharacterized protein n=1 Tax=Brachionus plicatilis TaxID=10195 RepID=A0A3M7S8X4_BRAPC|nr:hypothetical protein BpHYR1_040451 [Brachionus plicatilis]